ncbi:MULTISPECIES: GNAT family N-acetyltransferase [Pseudomonas]|uniref:GNAT family N-acetyltransferase n=1 Tax=Pseudomonas TaxID=286 RepID=UPI000CD1E3A8|nr:MULTISPECIES: GNAT family N-acetyltransferase [Pseudomonas]NHX01113.1 GNAT family N-acetyltransferase [Pseudomonas koreensis]POA21992.1 GNAT family N-acetyltransferase [Pseudomonas sp. FW305-3-2-15-E-TSA4]POA43335.1 GNAT family N-acetyltransferase [Pseudomonas sp. FW305-3-2-15-E-TSA2]
MFDIRRATPDDAQIAFDIRRLAIRHQCIGAYSEQQMLDWTKGAAEDGYDALMERHFYLGCIEGEAVATGMLDLDYREIGAIFIRPDFMQRGLGKRVLYFLEDFARDLGLTEVCLDATLNAVNFYRRCGYIGEESAVYQSPSGLQLACVPMVKTLG